MKNLVKIWYFYEYFLKKHGILFFPNFDLHDICMVSTRSPSKIMSITREMRDYFESLMEPLVTNEKLEQKFKSFQDGLMKKIEEQNTRIEELESKLAMKQNVIDNLEIKCDDNEQYSRRSCLRVHSLEFNSDNDEGVMKKVEKCCKDMDVEFNENEINRAHYISKPYVDKVKNKKVRSLIIKFKSWRSRSAFYKSRPRNHLERQKKPGSSFNVSLDLTKRHYDLLMKAKGRIINNPSVAYVFCDINCLLVMKFNNNTYRYFNSESELAKLLDSKLE